MTLNEGQTIGQTDGHTKPGTKPQAPSILLQA